MNSGLSLLIDLIIIVIFLWGVKQFQLPSSARRGNLTAAFALGLALTIVLLRHKILQPEIVLLALLVGTAIGWYVAIRVNMIQIPAMVAFQHGAGGIAAFLISFVELTRYSNPVTSVGKVSGILSLIIGAATFSGSLIASGKLASVIKQTPIILRKHNWIISGLFALIVLLGIIAGNIYGQALVLFSIILITLSVLLGVVFSIRIGGADMPVLISFLNATAGIAAAFCGVIIQNRLLIACGATVAASGSILTHVMCKGMNRSLLNVFKGFEAKKFSSEDLLFTSDQEVQKDTTDTTNVEYEQSEATKIDPYEAAIEACTNSKSIIIIPGYGMALAQAQFMVFTLSNIFIKQGSQVKFAVHPLAGRMPGHMHVLLAEAEVPYDRLYEMKDIGSELNQTDLAIVIGACDVVNPAAINTKGTPISGMPILHAHEAKQVIVCNLDEKPGYSGVENPLYKMENVILLMGDAKEALTKLIDGLSENSNQ